MLLELRNVAAAYGLSQVLFNVSFSVREGEVISLIGRNGMGKTTTVRTLMGILTPRSGRIRLRGAPINGLSPYLIVRLGLGLVPEGRQIFPNLTVRENLLMAVSTRTATNPWTVARVFELFPCLNERVSNYGNQLSGGEQQMLAIGRALMTNPALLVLDEATEGLAPLIREDIWATLHKLKQLGLSIIVIDKDLEALCRLADRHYIIEKGEVVWNGTTPELMADSDLHDSYLGV